MTEVTGTLTLSIKDGNSLNSLRNNELERVTLRGGPWHGHEVNYYGGDIIWMSLPVSSDIYVYRKSPVLSSTFEFHMSSPEG